jgi:hypothetical protein
MNSRRGGAQIELIQSELICEDRRGKEGREERRDGGPLKLFSVLKDSIIKRLT